MISRKLKPLKVRHGLMPTALGLTMILLSACSTLPNSGERITPELSASFLDCVRTDYQARNYGPCTVEMLKDWMVQNGL